MRRIFTGSVFSLESWVRSAQMDCRASASPSRVMKGIRGPGQMGNKRVTQRGLEVVEVRAAENLLFVRGAVPGPRNGVVEVRSDG